MRVFDQVRMWVEEGVLLPGETLKNFEIAERLGVSRTPVREALQMLEQLGMVTMVPSQSTRVAPVNVNDAELLYPLLGVLVGFASETAVPLLTTSDLSRLRKLNERLLQAALTGDVVGTRTADRDFHAIFIDRAGNRYLSSVIESLAMHIRRLESLYFSDVAISKESYRTHGEIIDAAAGRDAVKVAQLTRVTFERSGASVRTRGDGGATEHFSSKDRDRLTVRAVDG